MKSTLPFTALRRGSWASVVSASASPTTPSSMVLQTALADQTGLLQGWQARIESFLERAEAALSRLSLVAAMLQATLQPLGVAVVDSTEVRGTEPYGCFSPRVWDNSPSVSASSVALPPAVGESIVGLAAPVLQLMPELRDICSNLASPMSLERLEVDSSTTLCKEHVSSLSCEQLKVPKSIVSLVPAVEDVLSVVPRVDDVDVASWLVPVPTSPLVDDNDTKKFNGFYDFLDKWVAHQPTSGKTSDPAKKMPSKEKPKKKKNKKCGAI
ncbi:hypothetical protein VPH35_001060 [Triticum aestivum]|uniref:uncharacterized protein n=1 Tax=Triticum aestivum TaxID=4565 RepID=UPI0008428FA1|nr:uncharacterized protein LOC123190421 [Triticum aestivum]